jgi:hypothetical protein
VDEALQCWECRFWLCKKASLRKHKGWTAMSCLWFHLKKANNQNYTNWVTLRELPAQMEAEVCHGKSWTESKLHSST